MPDTIAVDGRPRTYTIVGATHSDRPRDLLLVFHGSKQTGEAHRRFTGGMFDGIARRDAAVVAYLDGHKGNWNDARKESFFPARTANVDDVSFARALIATLRRTHGIDPGRVFAIGYSNGGQMVMRLIHEAPELLAGAAVFSATMPAPASFLAPPASTPVVPMPVLLIHGTKDPIVPYGGGEMRGWAKRMFQVSGATLSMPETADYFARRNGIADDPTTSRVSPVGDARLWISRTAYRDGIHPPVTLLTVHGGGHTLPGPKKAPFFLGRTSRDVSTADEVAAFFALGGANGS